MNRKIRIAMIFALVLFMFCGVGVFAQEESLMSEEAAPVNISEASEGEVKPLASEESLAEENSVVEGEKIKKDNEEVINTENVVEENNSETIGDVDNTKLQPQPQSADKPKTGGEGTEKPAPTNEGVGAEKPESKPEEKKPEENKNLENETPSSEDTKTNPEENSKEEAKQVEPSDELKELDKKIKEEKNPNKKKKLQKEYNEKYLAEVEASGAEKLDEEILKRFTDEERTKKFYEIQAKKKDLVAKKEKGKLTQKDIDEYNKLLGGFDPPRLLNEDEKKVLDEFNKSIYIPGLENANEEWNKTFEEYKKAKEALKDALDPEKKVVSKEELDKRLNAFKELQKKIKDAIDKGEIEAKFTEGNGPEVKVFPFDFTGGLGSELKKDDNKYYIPDNTPIELLVQINKDKSNDSFTFTIKPEDIGTTVPEASIKNLVFLNGNPVKLTKNEDGSYSFTTTADEHFGIAQLKFSMPGFKGPFHNGFKLTMKAGETEVSKEFLITKKGYENEANIGGPGSNDKKNVPEIDAGSTENSVVNTDTDKVIDFFSYLKKSNTYIDKVIINSGNGESLPLSSVEITFTLPKHGGNVAEYIHKSGLKYHKNDDGTYILKLDTKTLGGNLTKDEDGNLFVDGKVLTSANITDAILENGKDKVYIDKDGNSHEVETNEVLEGGVYKVDGNKLYKKGTDNKYSEVGSFGDEIQDEDFGKVKKFVKDDTTYILKGNKLLSYKSKHNVYDGHVSNKDGKADPNVTPTVEGNQVTIVDGDKTSYGGTIIKNGIYDKVSDKDRKYFKKDGYTGVKVAWIDETGKKKDDITEGEKKSGNYKKVKNAVFKDGYIISNLEYKEGYTLVDKFGRLMTDVEVKKDQSNKFQFTKTSVKKDEKGNSMSIEIRHEGKQDSNRTISVGADAAQIYVDNKNYVVDGNGYVAIKGKYYYDGTKFVAADEKGIKGNKYFDSFKSQDLESRVIESYKITNEGKKESKTVDGTTKRYNGSTNREDYYKIEDKIYVKKSENGVDYYVSTDGKAEVLSEKEIVKIVQTLGKGKNAEKIITDETSIFDAVQNAKFGLRFPGFLAGKEIVYNLKADVKAKYLAPVYKDNKWQMEPRSIFKNEKGELTETKTVNKYFTLKNKKATDRFFFKNKPEELGIVPDINFFNIFYRDGDDRQRDNIIKGLLNTEKTLKEKEEAAKKDGLSKEQKEAAEKAVEDYKKNNKKDLELIAILQKELACLYDDAKFELKDDKLIIKDKYGEEIKLNRSLLWEIGFTNNDGGLFPEDSDSSIIIEDHNMDNRLIYDEIIVNEEKDKWEARKKEFEDAKKAYEAAKQADDKSSTEETKKALKEAEAKLKEKKFSGTDEYFFLDQIDNIRFGVNPNYIDNRFVPLGTDFKITSEEILNSLGTKNEATITKNGIEFKITRDTEKGQIRIKVLNAYYKKNDSYDKDSKDNNNKFYSPVQKAYQDKINGAIESSKSLSDKSKEELKNSFATVVDKIHSIDSKCNGAIKEKFEELIKKVEVDEHGNLTEDGKKQLTAIKKSLINEITKLKLGYLDNSKGEYKFDDMRFNAIRIELKPGTQIGGAMDNSITKKLGITSIINPMIDIPYTDEYGNILTNKDKYLNEEINKILKDGISQGEEKPNKTFDPKTWNKNEDSYREVLKAAYEEVNNKYSKLFKKLAVYDDETKTYKAIAGSELDYSDLATGEGENQTSIKNKYGKPINGFYIGEGKNAKKFGEDIKDENLKKSDAYKEVANQEIDLAAYYMSSQGYGRRFYQNFAEYKMVKAGQGPGIFEYDDNWKKTICYPGLGHCIEIAGNDSGVDKTDAQDEKLTGGKADSKFEITYEPSIVGPEEEKPKVEKKSETEKIDLSTDERKNKKVDFTIDITVDKLNKEQKQIAEAMKSEDDKGKQKDLLEGYNKNGFYEYKNGLIIDFLPDVFELKNGESTITLTVNKEKLMANGANKSFESEDEFNKWKNNIKYLHVEDVNDYLKSLPKDQAEILQKAIEQAIADGRIKKDSKQQAILAWLPDFEAPHGSENQFTFELKNLNVNVKKFKEYADPQNLGQLYTNHAAFGDKAKFYFGKKGIRITDGHNGKVNKYLQLLDKDGKVLNKEEAEGWFKGNAEIKFGDKFNYKISIKRDSEIIDTGIAGTSEKDWELDDLFAQAKGKKSKGLRPVLRDFVQAPNGFEVLYKVGEEYKTQKEMEDKKIDLSKVTGIRMKAGMAGFPDKTTQEFILPMMIPEFDAKIENGKVIYIGTDGEKHELGNAEDFFNLKDLKNKDKELAADNSVTDSNTVTIYLEKERFIKLYKEFFEADGTEIKTNRPEVKFNIYQIVEIDGKKTRVKLEEQLTLNEANKFVDKVDHLPLFKKITTIDEKGNVKVEIVSYSYEVEEVPVDGYEGKVFKFDESDEIGFVLKAKNTRKPNNPPEFPDNPPGNPPEEPNTPPDVPEEPGIPENPPTPEEPPKPEEPEVPHGGGKIRIPKTGVKTDLASVWMSGLLLIALVFLKKKYFKR